MLAELASSLSRRICLPLFLCGVLGACGEAQPDSISVVVHVPPVASDSTSLTILATLDGQKAMQDLTLTDPTKFDYFGVRLPLNKSGLLALNIDVFDANSCKLGTAQASTPIGPPLQVEISATLTLLGTRQCPLPTEPQTCAPATFCWSTPKPQGNPIRGMFALSDTDIWAVGDVGTVVHYNGTAWSSVASSVTDNLLGVWASSASDVYSVGENGRIIHWNGTAFAVQNSGLGTPLRAVWGSSSGDVYAVGDSGRIIHSGGNGSWGAPVTVPGSTDALNAITGTGPNSIYVVGNNGAVGFYNGTWSKQTVTAPANITNLFGVASVGGTSFAVGAGGTILMLSGTTWTAIAVSPTTQQLNAIYGRGASDFWVVGASGTRLRYTGAWVDASGIDGNMTNLSAVHGSAAAIWAGGDAGALLKFGGTSWSAVSQGSQATLRSVYGFSPKNIWAVGDGGTILHYDGTNWIPASSGTTQNLNNIWGLAPNDLWAVGNARTILRYNGSAWQPRTVQNPNIVNLNGVWGTSDDDVWAVGTSSVTNENNILHFVGSSESSISVQTAGATPAPEFYTIWGISSQIIYIGAKNAIMTLTTDVGTNIKSTPASNNVRSIWGSRINNLWAVGDGGIILYNSGTGFVAVSSPVNANLNSVWGSGATDIWASGTLGAVIHYDGKNWNVVNSGTHNSLNSVWGSNSIDTWLVGATGTILHTLK